MPQESPHETNDSTNSSAPGKLVVYQKVNFVSEKHSLVLYVCEIENFAFTCFFFNLVALSNLNQPTSSNTSATVIVQNTLQPPNDYPMQEGNILNWPSAASANCNLINTQNKADAGRSKSGYLRPISSSSIRIMIS